MTATPGNNLDQVLEVVRNVRASRVVLKDEEDEDVVEYLYLKQIEPIEVKPNEQIVSIEKKVNEILVRLCSILVRCLLPEEGRLVPRTSNQIRFDPIKKAQDLFSSKREFYLKMVGPDIVTRCHECFSSAISFLHVRKALVDQGYVAFVKKLNNFTTKMQVKIPFQLAEVLRFSRETEKKWRDEPIEEGDGQEVV